MPSSTHRQPENPAITSAAPVGILRQIFWSLEVPNFRRLWLATILGGFATQLSFISVPWLTYELSDSGTALGLVTSARFIPQLIISPLAGALVDRWDKRAILLSANLVWLFATLANAVLVHTNAVQLWHLAAISFVTGAAISFNIACTQAAISDMLPASRLSNAVALNFSALSITTLAAPLAVAVLMATSHAAVFDATWIAFLIGTVVLFSVRLTSDSSDGATSLRTDVGATFRYVWDNSARRSVTALLILGMVLGNPFRQLLPAFQQDVYQASEAQLGLMYASTGFGALVATTGIACLPATVRLERLQIGVGLSLGASLVAFALSQSLPPALLLLFVVGAAAQGYLTLNNVVLLRLSDRRMHGRMTALQPMGAGAMALALIPMGLLIDSVGVRPTLAGASGILLIGIAAIGILLPRGGNAEAKPPG